MDDPRDTLGRAQPRSDGRPRMSEPPSGEESSPPVVLHVCTRYQRGGSERRIRDSIRALPDARHHLLLGRDSDVELARQQTAADRVWTMPTLVRQVSPLRDVSALVALWRLLRRGTYSAVISHQSKAGILARTAAAFGGPPAVHSLSMASFGPGYGRLENLLFARLERLLGNRTAGYCVVGDDLAQRFAAVGVPPDRLHVVRSGIPLPEHLRPRAEARHLLRDRYGIDPARRLICYVGSLEPRKNPLLLARLLRELHDRLADPPDLLVLGDGPLRGMLDDELRLLGLADHAVVAGYVADPDLVHDALRGVDVVVLLSDAEGLPQVLVQSAASGTPFVAFEVEGVREILALGASGSAVPHGRLDAVVEAVERWLPDAGTTGREPVADLRSWSPDSITAGYRRVIGAVLPTAAPADLQQAPEA
jgi:glycosyltransferase involved in cell wall biosynthesis